MDSILVHIVAESDLEDFIEVVSETVDAFESVEFGGEVLRHPVRATRRLGRKIKSAASSWLD